jgi:hypothetical protein
MDFGEILAKAWKTIWKHKILWLFGILAGCGASSGGGGGGGGGSSSVPTTSPPNGGWDGGPSFFSDFYDFITEIPPWVWIAIIVGVIALAIILSILFLMIGAFGQSGVIKGASMADQQTEGDKALSLGEIFKGIKPHFWKVFLLNLGLRVAGFLITLLLAIPLFIFFVCTCFLGALLLIPIGWFIEILIIFSTIAIIEEGLGIFKGIERGWQVVTRNLGNVVVMFLILGLGQLIIGLFLAVPILIAVVPFLINLAITGMESLTIGLILSGLMFLIALPLVIVLAGVLKAYVLSSWTLTYRRLTGDYGYTPTVITTEDAPDAADSPDA